jgi:hypothetical protein
MLGKDLAMEEAPQVLELLLIRVLELRHSCRKERCWK